MNARSLRTAALLSAALLLTSAGTAWATPSATAVRIAGKDRYQTAEGLAASGFTGRNISVAVVATGESFADALAASYLAGGISSPILLTPTDTMDPGLPDALKSIGVTGVEVVGGTSAVSDTTVNEIQGAGYQVTRLAGATRFETAKAIAEAFPPEAIGEQKTFGRTMILVNGLNFADALAAGPMSYSQGWPILLTNADRLQGDTGQAIKDLGIKHAIIVGGTGVVSQGVVDDLTTLGVTSERLAGETRTITAQAVANFTFTDLGYHADDAILARGDSFADALSAGPRGGDELEPILLTPSPTDLGSPAAAYISGHTDEMKTIEVFGGTSAISDGVMNRAQSLARGEP